MVTPAQYTFRSFDGAELVYRHWSAQRPSGRSLILFHRGHEHSGRWQETIDQLALDDVDAFAWDQRGHGQSPGERGSARDLATVIRDADAFAHHLEQQHGVALPQTVVLAHSVGAVIAAAWVHDYAPPLGGMVLAAPALRVKLYVPLAIPLLRLKQKLLGPGYVKSYVKSKMLTHDPEQARAYDADPAIFRQISVKILLDLHDAGTRLIADAGAITTPTLILASGKDWIVKLKAQWTFFERLSSPIKQMELYPEMYHAIFQEAGRYQVIDRTRAFIRDCFDRPARRLCLKDADKGGHTRTEYDRLRLPASLRWRLTRQSLRALALLSNGIRLGCTEGFDSGVMLDYVYANRPSGRTPLGRLVDYFYLNSIGWRGIRVRRQNMQQVLRRAIEDLHARGIPVRILDIAAGPGRYVLETVKALPAIAATVHLRDYKPVNTDAARRLADELQLPDVTVEPGDAFDADSLAAVSPKPTIAIASGIYELFPMNAPVRRSLAGLAAAVEPGGYLIYTCQPWHPQVEFIARALTNHQGAPWIMRRRTTGEMDQLVAAAGFEKVAMEIDPWGIFTVSLARRLPL